jgi:short-subunit dehydrogenase
MIQETLARYSRIDVLVNNAGFGRLNWLENSTLSRTFRRSSTSM